MVLVFVITISTSDSERQVMKKILIGMGIFVAVTIMIGLGWMVWRTLDEFWGARDELSISVRVEIAKDGRSLAFATYRAAKNYLPEFEMGQFDQRLKTLDMEKGENLFPFDSYQSLASDMATAVRIKGMILLDYRVALEKIDRLSSLGNELYINPPENMAKIAFKRNEFEELATEAREAIEKLR
jgi:hypothetical protein